MTCEEGIKIFNGYSCYNSTPIEKEENSVTFLVQSDKDKNLYSFRIITQISKNDKGNTELMFLKSFIDSEFILKLIEYRSKNNKLFEILEYMNNRSLKNFIATNPNYFKNEDNVINFAKDLVRTLLFLGTRGIIHGNLNLKNIIMNEDNKPKLSDFSQSVQEDSSAVVNINNDFSAPELMYNYGRVLKWSNNSDKYSLGVILYYILFKRYPFNLENKGTWKDKLIKGEYRVDKGTRQDMLTFIQSCLQYNPEDRATLYEMEDMLNMMLVSNQPVKRLNYSATVNIHNHNVISVNVSQDKLFMLMIAVCFLTCVLLLIFLIYCFLTKMMDGIEKRELTGLDDFETAYY